MTYETAYEIIRDTTRIFAALMLIKYTTFLLVAPFHHVKEAWRAHRLAKHRVKPYMPPVTVIVPAWNEEVGILGTLQSLLDNTYANVEVIVVNDGSTDGTHDIVKSFMKDVKKRQLYSEKSLIYYRKKNEGKGKALNHAIERARGDIILTVDSDSFTDPDMIKNIVKYFEDDNIDAVVGNVKVAGDISFLNLLQRLEYLFGFYHKRAHSVLGAEYIYGGACAAFRKKTVFDKLGLFDADSLTEDIEMSLRTRAYGYNAVYADDALCYTEGAGSILGLVKQRTRWKRGRFQAFGRYKRLFFSTRVQHNVWLAWFILPFAMLAEIQLLFEPIGVTLLVVYSLITGDYSSLILGAIFMGIMYIVVGLLTERGRNWWIVPLAPFTWMIFYVLVWVEYMALVKSLASAIRAEAIAWQKWQRKGIGMRGSHEEAQRS